MMRHFFIVLFFLFVKNNLCFAQSTAEVNKYPTATLDFYHLPGNDLILLLRDYNIGTSTTYKLFYTDILYTDSFYITIDSIEHVPCGGPNSIFFIDDSTGFLFESGGCYAYYNWMYRTSDKGNTWKKVVFETGTELFPDLSAKNFYMFGRERGIIIWQIANGNLIYSITTDGGYIWKREMQNIGTDISVRNIDNIHFAANGQILVTVSEYTTAEMMQNPATVFQSDDFGKSWRMLK